MAILDDDDARAAVAAVVEARGVVLLGETHGVVENASVLAWFVRAFGPVRVALEWTPQAVDVLRDFAAGHPLDVAPLRPSEDGRITPQHFSILRDLSGDGLIAGFAGFAPDAFARPPDFALPPDDPSQNAWERALAERLLAARNTDTATLAAAAGSIHALLDEQPLRGPDATVVGRMFARDKSFAGQNAFRPMGWHVAQAVPTVSIRLRYGGGSFTNFGVRRFANDRTITENRFRYRDGRLTVEIKSAHAAVVPGGDDEVRR